MPLPAATLFRALVVLLMAAHVFFMYGVARTLEQTLGVNPWAVARGAGFALVMMLPFVWAIGLPELPEILRWRRGQRRWEQGRCPGCGYRRRGSPGETCPECGIGWWEPPTYRFTVALVRRFVVLVVVAWILGAVSGELWLLDDERDFRREVAERTAAGDDTPYVRARRWPAERQRFVSEPGGAIRVEPY